MSISRTRPGIFHDVALLVAATATGCSRQQEAPPATTAPAADASIPATSSPYEALPDAVRLTLDKPFTGDLDEMVKRRAIRVAVTFNRTHYFIDMGQERGMTYDALKQFETDLNAELKTGNLKVNVVMLPMSRDQLYPALASGTVDMVAALVTVTPELERLVAFSEPTRTDVNQVVITGPGAPPIATVDDLAGQEVLVRTPSVYEQSLQRLVRQRRARGLGADRTRNSHLRQQHLQVLHRLPSHGRATGSTHRCEGSSRQAQVMNRGVRA